MWVIDLENAPDRLRGSLARWAVEVRAGLYVGSSGPKARDAIWTLVAQLARADTSAVLIYDTRGPQGFEVSTLGPNRREIVDMDGLWLARFHPLPPAAEDAVAPTDPAETEGFDVTEVDPGFLEP